MYQPKIDTSDAIGSLAGILGPTPEERAAQEQQLQQHRRKMHGWTALFNGLRHLSNLYYTSKGAAPQRYGDPHQQVEQQLQEERQRMNDIRAHEQQYYSNLWSLSRQIGDERRREALAAAQATYYGTRDEVARLKAENDRLKNEANIRNTDARTAYTQERTNDIVTMREPKKDEIQSRIAKNRQTGNAAMVRASRAGGGRGGGFGTVTTTENTYNEDGKVVKKVVTKGGPRSSVRTRPTGGGQRSKTVRKSRTQL